MAEEVTQKVAEDVLGAAERRTDCHLSAAELMPRLPLGGTLRTHEKSLTQDVAKDMLGAAKDGNVKLFIVKVLILPIVICQRC